MLTILSEIKFLTTRDDVHIKENDFGAFKCVLLLLESLHVTICNQNNLDVII